MTMILWVDDDPATLTAFRDELQDEGYEVLVKHGPEEMWESLLEEGVHVDGIIMDVLMPIDDLPPDLAKGGLSTGIVLIRQIRDTEDFRGIPILVFTIRAARDVDQLGIEYNIPVIRKQDTSPDEFLESVRKTFGDP